MRHYFRHYFVLFTFNSMLSFLFYHVNLPKGKLLVNLCVSTLIDGGRVTHICVGNIAIIGSDNCLSPGRRHVIIWTDAGILLTGPSGTDFNEISIIIIHFHSRKFIWKCGPQISPMNFAFWVVRKMAAISSWPPGVNILRPNDAYIHRWFMSSFI